MRLIYAIFILLLALMTSAQCQQTAEDWFKKANLLHDQGKHDDAIRCLDEAIKLDPKNATAWNNIGFSFYNQGKYNESIKAYNEAIRL